MPIGRVCARTHVYLRLQAALLKYAKPQDPSPKVQAPRSKTEIPNVRKSRFAPQKQTTQIAEHAESMNRPTKILPTATRQSNHRCRFISVFSCSANGAEMPFAFQDLRSKSSNVEFFVFVDQNRCAPIRQPAEPAPIEHRQPKPRAAPLRASLRLCSPRPNP
jgi:hypothetical protein